MNLIRLIVVAAAIWLAIRLLRRLLSPAPRSDRSAAASPGNMVRCAECGLHLPQPEAIAAGDRYFCCEAHRRRAAGS